MHAESTDDTRMLTELERQQRYLDELPKDFQFPLFSGRQAVESQRKSGYKTTARAAREIVDNAVEAGARNVWITFDRLGDRTRRKHQRKDSVTAVAFIDDGPGMLPGMVRYALSWGGGTHAKEHDFIGKFGFGLPNSSINQTRRVEVYTRTDASEPWMCAHLDINEVPQFGMVNIDPPTEAELPAFVKRHLKAKDLDLRTGTVVVWVKPDRLTYSQAATLKDHLIHDFGVVYRYMLDDVRIVVEEREVAKTDPLFLMPDARLFRPAEDGGSRLTFERRIPVKFWRDPDTGAPHMETLPNEQSVLAAKADAEVEEVGVIQVKVARFPVGFVKGSKDGSDASKRFAIRKTRRGMSFVRAQREIEVLMNFPTSKQDEASGLGSWPLLQSYAYHWALEVRFPPSLDEAFGIGNDKQTVRPVEDFWRVLHANDVDAALKEEDRFQRAERARKKKEKEEEEAQAPETHTLATDAAGQAELIDGAPKPAPSLVDRSRKRTQEDGEKRAQETGEPIDEAIAAVRDEARRVRFAVKFFEAEGGVFFKPDIGPELVKEVHINRAHPFYQSFYTRVMASGDAAMRGAVDLLLMALAKAELEAIQDDEAAAGGPAQSTRGIFYASERTHKWSRFLDTSIKILDQFATHDDDTEEPEEGNDDEELDEDDAKVSAEV